MIKGQNWKDPLCLLELLQSIGGAEDLVFENCLKCLNLR